MRPSDMAKQTTLIISNEEMDDIVDTEENDLLIKGFSKTTKKETKEQKGGFLSMLLDTLVASLFGNLPRHTIKHT